LWDQFAISSGSSNTFNTSYDYDSVLHYGPYSFAIDTKKPTITPKDPKAVIGQRTHLSKIDIIELNMLYKCK